MTQRTEELHGLQDCISQRKGDLKEALRDGETEAHEKLRQIRVSFPNEFSSQYSKRLEVLRTFQEVSTKSVLLFVPSRNPLRNRAWNFMVSCDKKHGPDAQIRTPQFQ